MSGGGGCEGKRGGEKGGEGLCREERGCEGRRGGVRGGGVREWRYKSSLHSTAKFTNQLFTLHLELNVSLHGDAAHTVPIRALIQIPIVSAHIGVRYIQTPI